MLCELKNGRVYLNVKAIVRASKNSVTGIRDDLLLVSTTSVPEDNKANVAIIKILSHFFGVAKTKIQIVSGAKTRMKTFAIEDADIETISALLRSLHSGKLGGRIL